VAEVAGSTIDHQLQTEMEVAMKTKLVAFIVALIFCASYSSGNDGQVARKGIGGSTSTVSGDRSAPAAITTRVAVSVMIGEAGGASVYFPIIAGRRFRIEPELCLFVLRKPVGASNNVYFGPRVGRFASSMGSLFSSEVGPEPVGIGYLAADCAGLEHGFSHLAIPFEPGLDYLQE